MSKILILLLLPFFCQANDTACNHLREGLFKLISTDGSPHTIVRTKTKQRENVSTTGVVSEYDIIWTTNCTYKLFNRRVIMNGGNDDTEIPIDTFYNQIVEIKGTKHKIITYVNGYDFKIESTLEKSDTALIYSDLCDVKMFKEFSGATSGGTLIGENFCAVYKENIRSKEKYLLGFEEAFSINHRGKFKLLDYTFFILLDNENIATTNCKFNDKYDKEIIAIYTSSNDKEQAKIIKAWRLNRQTNKIETVDTSKVKYKVADKNFSF